MPGIELQAIFRPTLVDADVSVSVVGVEDHDPAGQPEVRAESAFAHTPKPSLIAKKSDPIPKPYTPPPNVNKTPRFGSVTGDQSAAAGGIQRERVTERKRKEHIRSHGDVVQLEHPHTDVIGRMSLRYEVLPG